MTWSKRWLVGVLGAALVAGAAWAQVHEFRGGGTGGGWVDGPQGANSFAIACNGNGDDFINGGVFPDTGSSGFYCSDTNSKLHMIDENGPQGRIINWRRECFQNSDTGIAVGEYFTSTQGLQMGTNLQPNAPNYTGGNPDRGVIVIPNFGMQKIKLARMLVAANTDVTTWAGFDPGETRTLRILQLDTSGSTNSTIQDITLARNDLSSNGVNFYQPSTFPSDGIEIAASAIRGIGLQYQAESAATGSVMRLTVCFDIEELDFSS